MTIDKLDLNTIVSFPSRAKVSGTGFGEMDESN